MIKKNLCILLLLFVLCLSNNNIFIGNNSDWMISDNWSLGTIPSNKDNVYIINKNVELKTNFCYNIKNLFLKNSKLRLETDMNITGLLCNNGNINIVYSTFYVWSYGLYIPLKSGNINLNNSILVPTGDLYINTNDIMYLSGDVTILTNVYNYGLLKFNENTSLIMAYVYNLTQYDSGIMEIIGYPVYKIYKQQYIFMCYIANINGTLKVNYGGKIGHNDESWWFFIIPSMLINNQYNINIISPYYKTSLKVSIEQTLIVSFKDI